MWLIWRKIQKIIEDIYYYFEALLEMDEKIESMWGMAIEKKTIVARLPTKYSETLDWMLFICIIFVQLYAHYDRVLDKNDE